MDPQTVEAGAAVASALVAAASLAVALAATSLAKRSDRARAESEQRFEDLTVATLISAPSNIGQLQDAKKAFLREYDGKTPVFKR